MTWAGASGSVDSTACYGKPSREQGAQKRVQPCDEKPQIMSCGDQDGVDGIACGAGEVITFKQAIGFGVADDRLNGISASDTKAQ